MFSICAFLRNSLPGLCSFSLNCAGRLSETQTLPSYPLQEPHRQVEPPLLPAEEATIIYKSSCLSAFSEWSIVTPENRQKQLPLTEANENGSGDSLTVFGMFRRRTLIHGQAGAKNALSRKDAFAVMQASVERERPARRAARGLCGGEGFRGDGCHQCVRLWVTSFSLESLAFSFAIRKELLMLLLMTSNLLIFLPSTSC